MSRARAQGTSGDISSELMPLPPLSLAVVGADYPNKGKSPARRFELAICQRGEGVELRPEPKNLADEHAVAVYSCRGIQIGYVTAERAPRIGQIVRQGAEVRAVFQEHASFGAIVRVGFDGQEPALPPVRESEPEPDWWPDEEWPD